MQKKCINNGGEFGGEICQGEKGSPASPSAPRLGLLPRGRF